MDPKFQKQPASEKDKTDRSLKKYLAVATMAASLGVSLGVPVNEVLALDEKMSSPPEYSKQLKENVTSDQIKLKNQSNQGKFKSSIHKGESTQIKLDQEVDANTQTLQNQINK